MEETSVYGTMLQGLIRSVLASVPIHGVRVGWGGVGRGRGRKGGWRSRAGRARSRGGEGGEEIDKGSSSSAGNLSSMTQASPRSTQMANQHNSITADHTRCSLAAPWPGFQAAARGAPVLLRSD